MAEEREGDRAGIDLGPFGRRPPPPGPGPAAMIALAVNLVWLIAAGLFFLVTDAAPSGALDWAVTLVAVVLPVAMVSLAAGLATAARQWREEAAMLRDALDALRRAPDRGAAAATPSPRAALASPARAVAPPRDGAARGAISTRPPVALAPAPSDGQARFDLDDPDGSAEPELLPDEIVRALNFPEDTGDREGFRALRRALDHRETAGLVRAAQDLLTLLSQDGLYMDDMAPDRAKPDIWRRFAAGERGRPVAALGGIRDRSALARVAARMREDEVFRDAAHHFLRRFDKGVAAFALDATDQELGDLADTRTARAFMLVGRVAGTFD